MPLERIHSRKLRHLTKPPSSEGGKNSKKGIFSGFRHIRCVRLQHIRYIRGMRPNIGRTKETIKWQNQ